MKTIEDKASELTKVVWTCHISEVRNKIVDYMTEFEEEIRKDQDRITKANCAESVENTEYCGHEMGCGLEDGGITDRYESMEYGFSEAILKATESVENGDTLKEKPTNETDTDDSLSEIIFDNKD